MPSAPSQTRVINRALAILGSVQRIGHINEDSAPAKAALAVWDDVVDATLADHPWNFAIRRARLAASAEAPAFGWARAFEFPPDKLRWLPGTRGETDWTEAEEEGGLLLSDAPAPLAIRYIARVDDVALWSLGFREAMAWRLAIDMTQAVTAGAVGRDSLIAHYERNVLPRAKRQDGLATGARAQRATRRSDWLDAREGWSR